MFPNIYLNMTENVTKLISLGRLNQRCRCGSRSADGLSGGIMNIQERDVTRDQTLFTLLAAARRLRTSMTTAIARIGVSAAEYELLARLRAGAWCSVQDVQNDLLERLVKRGLIRRIGTNPNGSGVARITHAGRDMLEQCDIQVEVVRATFTAAFTAAERTALAHFLGRIP
jgi:hypothetical protein